MFLSRLTFFSMDARFMEGVQRYLEEMCGHCDTTRAQRFVGDIAELLSWRRIRFAFAGHIQRTAVHIDGSIDFGERVKVRVEAMPERRRHLHIGRAHRGHIVGERLIAVGGGDDIASLIKKRTSILIRFGNIEWANIAYIIFV